MYVRASAFVQLLAHFAVQQACVDGAPLLRRPQRAVDTAHNHVIEAKNAEHQPVIRTPLVGHERLVPDVAHHHVDLLRVCLDDERTQDNKLVDRVIAHIRRAHTMHARKHDGRISYFHKL